VALVSDAAVFVNCGNMAACLAACLPQRNHTTTATLLPLTSNCFKPLCSLILLLLLLRSSNQDADRE
jgi:hypothetical protein